MLSNAGSNAKLRQLHQLGGGIGSTCFAQACTYCFTSVTVPCYYDGCFVCKARTSCFKSPGWDGHGGKDYSQTD
eukprot:9452750-Pyramimonas_sp.AAC.1